MSFGAQPVLVPLCATWMRPSFKEDDATKKGIESRFDRNGKVWYNTLQ